MAGLAAASALDLVVALPGPRPLAAADIDALIAEVSLADDPRPVRRYCLTGVHFGAIVPAELTRLMFETSQRLPVLGSTSSSIQCAALTINPRDLALVRGLGFTRLVARCPYNSDLSSAQLSAILHQVLHQAKASGMDRVVLDLDERNLALLGQQGLERALDGRPDEVRFGQDLSSTVHHPLAPLAGNPEAKVARSDCFQQATRLLRQLGYKHLALHRWLQGNTDPAAWDSRDWLHAEGSIGCGPGAHGHLRGLYQVNPTSLESWREALAAGTRPPPVRLDDITLATMDAIWSLLTCSSIDLGELAAKDQSGQLLKALDPAIKTFVAAGGAFQNGQRLTLTAMGHQDMPLLVSHLLQADLLRGCWKRVNSNT